MAEAIPTLSIRRCVLIGSLSFSACCLLVFGTVAFAERWMYANLGIVASYVFWTLLFILSGALVFNSLVVGALRGIRFYLLFAVAFIAYAAGWCFAYFIMRGTAGEWCGSLFGSLLMGIVFVAVFNRMHLWLQLAILLFIANSLGYFIGSALYSSLGGKVGMLGWGVIYGLFLGAGIGASLHLIQRSK